ncbi:hypothetical protein HRbin29_00027 [bacterium HR29]|jgi:hypothetical protein|nr:hypothetical protein HRbin29_00027 [bacterium HR29]
MQWGGTPAHPDPLLGRCLTGAVHPNVTEILEA